MKKSILFVSHALELGGAERALLALLDALDSEKYDVDLFLLRQQGELLQKIPVPCACSAGDLPIYMPRPTDFPHVEEKTVWRCTGTRSGEVYGKAVSICSSLFSGERGCAGIQS